MSHKIVTLLGSTPTKLGIFMGNDMMHVQRYIVGLLQDSPTSLWENNRDPIEYITSR